MKRSTRIWLIVLLILVGVGLFAYPMVSNYLFSRNASMATVDYDDTIKEIDKSALEHAWAEAQVYNNSLEGNPVKDPFLKDSGMVMSEDYTQILNLTGKGIMGYVSIPKIGVKLSIYHGTSEEVLQKGAGHLEGSSLPIGGPSCHSVLTAHTGLAHAKMFTDLRNLVVGDSFYVHILDEILAYKVDQIVVVLPEKISELRREPGKDYCTLVTCTPYGVNTHRLFVRGVRTEYVPEVAKKQIEDSRPSAQWFTEYNMLIGLAAGAIIAAGTILILLVRRKKKMERRRRYWWWQIEDENEKG